MVVVVWFRVAEMCVKKLWYGGGVNLKIAHMHAHAEHWVCVCARVVCINERLGAPVCISVQVHASILSCSELCAPVLLNLVVIGSLFPMAARHRPSPSYVTLVIKVKRL